MGMRKRLFEMPDREALRVQIAESRIRFDHEITRERAKLEAEHARWERALSMDLDRLWFNALCEDYQVLANRDWSDDNHRKAYQNAYDEWPVWDYTPDVRRAQDLAEAEVDGQLDPFNPDGAAPTGEGSPGPREGKAGEGGEEGKEGRGEKE